ncbi:GDSL-type esterase/lipase family protein [Geodermatophilus maliterrae]|uniref:GDSL-type esterase/lipase family protein n=1 Tax=Geodermatophilus maliterrae TaxID=3162531 RepID=A0ABV3XGV1_9ACTN
MSAPPDVRVCFLGDSLTAGVGDPTGAGWVGPVSAAAREAGWQLTAYGLGVRRDTSVDVAGRWLDEARRRLRDGDRYGAVFAFGTNDVDVLDGRRRVDRQHSLTTLAGLLADAEAAGWPVLVIGPPPVADGDASARAADLADGMAEVCAGTHVPFVDLGPLAADAVWTAEVAAGDAVHPSAAGYRRLAAVVAPAFTRWLSAGALR